MPKISLCLIARDEERFLAACLASVRDAVDELIVVDTGSSDATRSIALDAGAQVLDFAWCDDFAAARNAGLERATGSHVLVLDADERLAQGGGEVLRRAAGERELLIGMLPLHDADGLDAREAEVLAGRRRLHEPAWLPRFFRRHPRLVFRRRVHETVLLDLDRALAESGGRIVALEAPLVHYGEVRELRATLGKRARNTRLLELALVDDPHDGELAGHLAAELARGGQLERARALAREHLEPFLARIDALPAGAHRPSPVLLAQVLATGELAARRPAEALQALQAAERRCLEPHPNLTFLAGLAHELAGAHAEAERCFRACLAAAGRRFTTPVDPSFTDAAPRLRLANLELTRGRAREALALLADVPARLDLPARLMRAEAQLVGRAPTAALRELAPLMSRPEPPPDLFALAAWAAALAGQPDPQLLEAAHRAPADRWVEARRKSLLRP